MRILISGASGFIGRLLSTDLSQQGHQVVALKRGKQQPPCWDIDAGTVDLGGFLPEAVIHLAGKNIACRWTRRNREAIVRSRVEGTRLLAQRLARRTPRPPCPALRLSSGVVWQPGR